MSKTICLDFGNTRLKLALFEDDVQKEVIILHEQARDHLEEILSQYQPQNSILSSVVNHDENIEILLKERTAYHRLSHLS